MTKDDFKKLCWSIFKESGFRKQKNIFTSKGIQTSNAILTCKNQITEMRFI